jgi:hypothetical protein
MSKGRQTMVRPDEVDNRERDLALQDRGAAAEPDTPAEVEDVAAAELAAMRARLSTAQIDEVIVAAGAGAHCRDCFRRGWRGAIAAIKG